MSGKQFRFQGKGLTFIQPWASAIAFAGKDIENRRGRSHYRGPLAIHAGAKIWTDQLSEERRVTRGGEKRPLIYWINRGRRLYGLEPEGEAVIQSHIIAIAMLVDCVEKSSSPWRGDDEWGLVLEGVIPIEPIPWVGVQGMWKCKFNYEPLRK